MILFGTAGLASPSMTVEEMVHHAAIAGIYRPAAPGLETPPVEVRLAAAETVSFDLRPRPENLIEEFDWSDKRISRGFVRLEQKVLAKVAEPDEVSRYQIMKRHRNSKAFAERQIRDYEEIRRLKKLSKKLLELQQYMQPIKL
jgi:hypothetical protein